MVGERAHYELAAGRVDVARQLLSTMESFANDGGMLPEQIWDSPDIPGRELYFGKPSGSAMPLAWAHAEYVKLLRSLKDGSVFDMPPHAYQRYVVDRTVSALAVWRFNLKCTEVPSGKTLRLEALTPALVHWSADHWQHVSDAPTVDTGFGLHVVDLPTAALPAGTVVRFTFYWKSSGTWEGTDFAVAVR